MEEKESKEEKGHFLLRVSNQYVESLVLWKVSLGEEIGGLQQD